MVEQLSVYEDGHCYAGKNVKVILAKVTDKSKFSDTVKNFFFQLQQDLKSNVPKLKQLPKYVSTKAGNVSTNSVLKNKAVQKTKAVQKIVQKNPVSKSTDLSDFSISAFSTLKWKEKKKGKLVKECSLENQKPSSLTRNKEKNKMSVTDSSSNVTQIV